MATEVVMPKLGLTMETGTIGSWLVSEGEEVQRGAPLLEVVTDKVTMEVEAQVAGVLRKILVPADQEVPVTTPIGILAEADEDIGEFEAELTAKLSSDGAGGPVAETPSVEAAPASPQTPPSAPPPTPAAATAATIPAVPAPDGRPHRASPKARRMAVDLGIDLAVVQGSGPGGRIVSGDLAALGERPAVSAQPAPPSAAVTGAGVSGAEVTLGAQTIALTRPQQVAAERLTASYREIPHIHIGMDVSGVWLKQFRQGYALEGKKISFNDLIVKALARTLAEQPRFNSILEGTQVRQLSEINIGVAADTPQGLMVPVVRGVPNLTIEQIATESRRLVDAARTGGLQPDDMMGGTFTVSNLGMLGVSRFTAIINPPQVAILAVGALEDRVIALENQGMAVRPIMSLSLAADHRALDGAMCARFVGRLKEILETPGLLA